MATVACPRGITAAAREPVTRRIFRTIARSPESKDEAMSDTKVYLLDGGTLVMDGLHAFWNAGPSGEIRFPCYSVLIDHRDGRYIYDTGYDLDHVLRELPFINPMQTKAQTIPGQLSVVGLRPQDIDYVINSHFHFDHCGGNKYLSRACSVCHTKALAACGCPEPFEIQSYSDLSFAPEIAARRRVSLRPPSAGKIYTPTFQTVVGDQEIAKGIHLFETPGHAAGHYSLLIELPHRRPMLFTGDAAYSQQNLDRMIISSFHLDPVESYKSMQRLKDLAARYDAEIFCSHDPQAFGAYLKAPGFYS
jgi:4-pyridoxolactonase